MLEEQQIGRNHMDYFFLPSTFLKADQASVKNYWRCYLKYPEQSEASDTHAGSGIKNFFLSGVCIYLWPADIRLLNHP